MDRFLWPGLLASPFLMPSLWSAFLSLHYAFSPSKAGARADHPYVLGYATASAAFLAIAVVVFAVVFAVQFAIAKLRSRKKPKN